MTKQCKRCGRWRIGRRCAKCRRDRRKARGDNQLAHRSAEGQAELYRRYRGAASFEVSASEWAAREVELHQYYDVPPGHLIRSWLAADNQLAERRLTEEAERADEIERKYR